MATTRKEQKYPLMIRQWIHLWEGRCINKRQCHMFRAIYLLSVPLHVQQRYFWQWMWNDYRKIWKCITNLSKKIWKLLKNQNFRRILWFSQTTKKYNPCPQRNRQKTLKAEIQFDSLRFLPAICCAHIITVCFLFILNYPKFPF